MRVGTKSVLFGVHQFLIHPLFMAAAWTKLYGFPWDPRLWVAFFVHDLGYIGKRDMDGPEGETHVELGAKIMHRMFDRECWFCYEWGEDPQCKTCSWTWHDFCLYHSRFYAKRAGRPFSRLCVADKQVFLSTPKWLYKIQSHLSGEIHEYMSRTRNADKYARQVKACFEFNEWHAQVSSYIEGWVAEHRDKTEDTWTKV